MEKAALVSVYDKRGVVEFCRGLIDLGYTIISSGGTKRVLSDNNVPVIGVSEVTKVPEMMGGRVKTLHPYIHGAVLARRELKEDMEELSKLSLCPIDVVCVNLYPFEEKASELGDAEEEVVEYIDIGGPALIRAAAKNFRYVMPVIDPEDYPLVLSALKEGGDTLEFRRGMASKVFAALSQYNLNIASYFSRFEAGSDGASNITGVILNKVETLRYGENPHQKGAFYSLFGSVLPWNQIQGKKLSYNNLLDLDAAIRLISSLPHGSSAVFKHLNPCGVGVSQNLVEALKMARKGDPRSHFGGIVSFNGCVDKDVAQETISSFVEIVIAPSYTEDALGVFSKKKNIRVIEVDFSRCGRGDELRSIEGGYLLQERDRGVSDVREGEVVTSRKPTDEEYEALQLAWIICAHVKSNALVASDGRMALSIGAGQMSRVDAAELLISRAKKHGNSLEGACVASDAFFPFPDSVEALLGEGVKAIVAPCGSRKDEEVAKAVERLGGTLVFVRDRHFRH
ncbi:MAG: bifunctional phosphoribosylaminoimidazolecarboxamide formyltransferase/IMP cyclohydrolase PurH [Candidatus Dadabacteria bacterium]|nr:MAG: bifunctional phosphoribosylaminoimidazolecarboxamide formyltransferase/IMP cyclohydrolase PurH [Candidatus Dadabacteria bacterium]